LNSLLRIITPLALISVLSAQTLKPDPSIISGTLNNGLTYTVKSNPKPKNTVEIRLIVKAGSLDEADDQQGLAHFVEHMAFNGTAKYPGNELINHLESKGLRFGKHINASTGYDKTLYTLTVPSDDIMMEEALEIVSEWAGKLRFDEEEFNQERGVILEEARSRDNVGFRLFNQIKPLIYMNSYYVNRTPIGDLNIVKNGSVSRAKAFYDTWYQPDMMEVIVVGDLNPQKTKSLIIRHLGTLSNSTHPDSVSRLIPQNPSTRLENAYDQEHTAQTLSIRFNDLKNPIQTDDDLRRSLYRRMALSLFNLKGAEHTQTFDPTALSPSVEESPLGALNTTVIFNTSYHLGNEYKALKELYGIIANIRINGFSEDDLAFVKKTFHRSNSDTYDKHDDWTSSSLAEYIVSSRLNRSVMTDSTEKYTLTEKLIDEVTAQELQSLFIAMTDNSDRVIIYNTSEPLEISRETVLSTIDDTLKGAIKISAKPTKKIEIPILETKPITSKNYHPEDDFYHYILENGISIYFKQTKHEKNKIAVEAFSDGGYSIYAKELLNDARKIDTFISGSGVQGSTKLELYKHYASSTISVNTDISEYTERIAASSNSDDIKKMFELMYLKLTDPSIDPIYAHNMKNKLKHKLELDMKDPSVRFSKELIQYIYNNDERCLTDTNQTIDALNLDGILKLYKDRYSDMNNFTFIIVGDVDTALLEKHISRYLGNLPTKKSIQTYIDRSQSRIHGINTFSRSYNKTNISNISISYSVAIPNNLDNALALESLKEILQARLRKEIREEKSGTYGIGVSVSLESIPSTMATMNISFSCDPKRRIELINSIKTLIKNSVTQPISSVEIEEYRKKYTISHKRLLQTNGYWSQALYKYVRYKRAFDENTISASLNKLDPESVQRTLQQLLKGDILTTEINPIQ